MLMTEKEFLALTSFPVRWSTDYLRAAGLHHIDRVVAASSYEASPLLRAAVHRFKYGRMKSYGRELGMLLAEASEMISTTEETVLCPVPLHWSRLFQRGFNQSQLLAECVSDERGWTVMPLLRRVRSTGHQARRSHEERRSALVDAFRVTPSHVPSHVILIDDIATTGSTLDACAEVLKMGGAERVEALVVATG